MRFLVGLDGSAKDPAVLAAALKLGRAAGAELLLLNVVNPLVERPAAPTATATEAVARLLEERRAYLERQATSLENVSVSAQLEQLQRGEGVDQAIGRVAHERQCDVVLIASKRAGRLRGLILGSVGQGLLTHSPCPVLIVRPE